MHPELCEMPFYSVLGFWTWCEWSLRRVIGREIDENAQVTVWSALNYTPVSLSFCTYNCNKRIEYYFFFQKLISQPSSVYWLLKLNETVTWRTDNDKIVEIRGEEQSYRGNAFHVFNNACLTARTIGLGSCGVTQDDGDAARTYVSGRGTTWKISDDLWTRSVQGRQCPE